jgi:flavin-dependent dehydrogenase
MPDGITAAQSLGISLRGAGYGFSGIRFCGADTSVQAEFPYGEGLGIRRTELHQTLVQRAEAEGVTLRWGTHIAGLSEIRARWIVGADGGHSTVRRWAGLEASREGIRRYGFRRHFRMTHGSDHMELHWGDRCQLYLTPVGPRELCIASISRDPHLRLDDAVRRFPAVAARLHGAEPLGEERGGITVRRRLNSVVRGNIALVGDASGSVDAITGEGLCLVFQQSAALARAMVSGDLSRYQKDHARIGRRPDFMSRAMLLLDARRRLRGRVLRAMAAEPRLFAGLLAMHVGELPLGGFLANSLALGWRMLSV